MRYVSLMIAAVALVTMALVGQSFATVITVSNPSFEDGTLYALPTNWSQNSGSGTSPGSFAKSDLTGLTSGYTGSCVGQVNSGCNGNTGASAYGYQDLTQNFVTGTTYTLTTAIGMRNDKVGSIYYAKECDWTLSLNYADTGAQVAAVSGTILNDATHTGFLTDQTVGPYVATSADALHAIEVRIFASTVGKTGGGSQAYGLISADNVRLDGVPIPEPGTLLLLTTGMLGLLAYAWRKRR